MGFTLKIKENIMKKFIIAIMIVVLAVVGCVSLMACQPPTDFTVGVIQLAPHDALDKANSAFCAELKSLLEAEGKTITFLQNNANNEDSQNTSIVNSFIGKNVDLIYSIATSSSQTAVAKAKDYDIPVIFNAVTDPVDAGLVKSMENPGVNVTGVSDINPIADQVGLMVELMADTIAQSELTIGVLFVSKETNSVVQKDAVKAECEKLGIKFAEYGIDEAANIGNGLQGLKKMGADIVYLPTDNVLASEAATVHSENIKKEVNLPMVCGEGGMTELCGVATLSVDYEYLGKLAAQSAFDILMGNKKASEIAVKTQTENYTYIVSEKNAEAIGFTIPQSIIDKANA